MWRQRVVGDRAVGLARTRGADRPEGHDRIKTAVAMQGGAGSRRLGRRVTSRPVPADRAGDDKNGL